MAIEIPTVKRIAPEAPASVGRLQVQLPNAQTDLKSTSAALDGVAEQAIKYRNQVADQHADTIATDAANQFEQRWKTEMYGDPEKGTVGAKFQTGDPTAIYKKFDDTMQGHLNDLSNNDQWDTETQNLVNRRLGKKAEELRLQTLTDYGNQQHKYDDGITGSGVKLAQQAMPDASTFIQPGDASTLQPIQTKIANIQNLRIAQALRYGGAQEDPNGQTAYTAPDGTIKRVTLGPATQLQIKKDLSDGLYGTMDNLVKTGTTDSLAKAQVMKDNFGDMLDPLRRDKLATEFKKSQLNAAAFGVADAARTSGNPDAALAKIDDPEVRHKALSIINEDQRNMEQIKGRQSKANFNPLMQHILEVMHSDTPYSGTNAMEADPLFKAMKDKITDPKQIQALYHAVEKPKENSPAALTKMQNLVTGQDPNNDITKMSPSDFALFKVGLNDSAQKKYDGIYEKAHTQSGAQIMTSYRYADKELADQMVGVGQVQKNQWGKFAGKDEAKMIQYRQEMEDFLATSDHPMKPDEIKQHVREYTNSIVTKQALAPINVKPAFNGGQQPAAPKQQTPMAPVPPPSTFGSMTPGTKWQYIQSWRKANNNTRETPSSAVLEDFIKKDTAK